MKHIVKWSFESTLSPEESDQLPIWKRYWSIYNLDKKEAVKFLKVNGTEHLCLFFMLEAGKYLISNVTDRYILTIEWDGKFKVKELNQKIDRTEYLFN